MKKSKRTILTIFNSVAKGIGYFILIASFFSLLFWFVWRPIKIANYEPVEPEHQSQKDEYLESILASNDTLTNIVLINFDDLGYGDLSCYGNKLIKTPAIDRLCAQGVRMTSFYSSSPVCTPSRAGLLTGRFPFRSHTANGVFFPENHPLADNRQFSGSANELPKDEITIAEILKAKGYKTGMIGKWHLGDRAGHLPNDFGFDEYFGVHYSNDMVPLHIYQNKDIFEKDRIEIADGYGNFVTGKASYLDPEVPLKTKGVDQTLLTDRYTQKAIEFIENSQNKPFFLYFAHTFPHVPHFASKTHAGQSEGGLYGDVVEDLDRSVDALIKALERLQLDKNTLVIITSDNGADFNGSSGDLRGRKFQTFEGGQRVPLIAYWKGTLPENLVTNQIAMNTDLFPTILNLANIPLPADRKIDGKNILPVWNGKESPHPVIYYFSTSDGMPKGARNDRFKYHTAAVKYNDIVSSFSVAEVMKPQLTDLARDNESHNLIKKYPNVAKQLESSVITLEADFNGDKRGWIDKKATQ